MAMSSCRKEVEAFLNKDVNTSLMLYAENGRDYVASVAPPAKFKKKAMFFVKTDPCALTPENIMDKVSYGDTSEAPLETLSQVASNVFLPLLTSPANQVGWPDVLSKEVSDSLHRFTANIFVTIGQTKGQTMLPLPAGAPSRFHVVTISDDVGARLSICKLVSKQHGPVPCAQFSRPALPHHRS